MNNIYTDSSSTSSGATSSGEASSISIASSDPNISLRSSSFSVGVIGRFNRRADAYDGQARLQQGLAWRLAHLVAAQPLPDGAAADLGAGSGALGQALLLQKPSLAASLRQLDLAAGLLALNPLAANGLLWDLNRGLPAELGDIALLTSSFALQWLERPAERLASWCDALMPAGLLAVAVPTAGSFPEWRQACQRSGVPFTGLALPAVEELVLAAHQRLQLHNCRRLRFRGAPCPEGGLALLRQLRSIGADGSPAPQLSGGQLRRLLHHWPQGAGASWEVLLLVGTRL